MVKQTRHLSLVMPGALGPVDLVAPAQLPRLPHFARLLARSQAQAFAADSLERALECDVIVPDDPEYIGAYGAALAAAEV